MTTRRTVAAAALALALSLAAPGSGRGDVLLTPLDPDAYSSLANHFAPVPGTYTFGFNGTSPTLAGNGFSYTGVFSSSGIAVFDFGSINITGDTFISSGLNAPVALLSRSSFTANSTVFNVKLAGAAWRSAGAAPGPRRGGGGGGGQTSTGSRRASAAVKAHGSGTAPRVWWAAVAAAAGPVAAAAAEEGSPGMPRAAAGVRPARRRVRPAPPGPACL